MRRYRLGCRNQGYLHHQTPFGVKAHLLPLPLLVLRRGRNGNSFDVFGTTYTNREGALHVGCISVIRYNRIPTTCTRSRSITADRHASGASAMPCTLNASTSTISVPRTIFRVVKLFMKKYTSLFVQRCYYGLPMPRCIYIEKNVFTLTLFITAC